MLARSCASSLRVRLGRSVSVLSMSGGGLSRSALYIFMVLYAFVFVNLICSEKVSFGSMVRPRILGNGFVARILLLMLKLRDLEYSAGSGVKRVV